MVEVWLVYCPSGVFINNVHILHFLLSFANRILAVSLLPFSPSFDPALPPAIPVLPLSSSSLRRLFPVTKFMLFLTTSLFSFYDSFLPYIPKFSLLFVIFTNLI